MKKVTTTNLAQALYETLENAEESKHMGLIKNFVILLSQKHMLGKCDEILKAYQTLLLKESAVVEATVTLKERLDKNTVHALREALKKRHKAKDVHIIEKVDERIIGGMKIQIGDTIYDRTLKNNLTQLASQLTR